MRAKGSNVGGLAAAEWKPFCLTLVLAIAFTLGSQAQSGTRYIYDELGRLVGVVGPSAEAARYFYDAAGNIISVSRYASAQVSIIQFTPNRGSPSTTVKIYGTAFSATASQDTVKFNGVPATVTSASVTELVTAVPSGASTGPITVTTPSGSATSTGSFTVGVSQTPTITSFSPQIGSPGTAVTVDGTNFQTTAGGNTARFNLAPSRVSSATSSSLQASVPAVATSGHISVVTPFGTGTSTADFFAPPSPYAPAQVEFTGRMSAGQTRTMTIGTAGDIGLMVFDETSDHRVSLVASNVTIASCGALSVLSPNGVTLASNTSICNASPGFLDTSTLTAGGTYTILGETTAAGGAGSVTLTIYDIPSDFIAAIVPDGSPVNVALTTPGQNAELSFRGTAGEKVSLNLTNATFPSCSPNLSIVNPNGTVLFSNTCFGLGGFVPAQTLPATGTYRILFTMADPGTGSLTATLYKVVNVTGTIKINGSSVAASLTTPGQSAALTFAGNASEPVTVHASNNTITCVTVGINNPDGSLLFSELECSSSFDLPTQTLPKTGTYTLSIVPYQAYTGSVTVKMTSP
jgi:YD repeat-containing protein